MAHRLTCFVTESPSQASGQQRRHPETCMQARLQLLGYEHFDVFPDGDSVSGVLVIRQREQAELNKPAVL